MKRIIFKAHECLIDELTTASTRTGFSAGASKTAGYAERYAGRSS